MRDLGRGEATVVLTACTTIWLAACGPSPAPESVRPGMLDVRPRSTAVHLPFGSGSALVYELEIVNLTAEEVRLVEVQPSIEGQAAGLATRSDELRARLGRFPGEATREHPEILGPWERRLFYGWLELSVTREPPEGGRLTVSTTFRGRNGAAVVATAPLVIDHPPLVIDAPVRGGRWLVRNGFGDDTDHRRFAVRSDSPAIPQRFGADFLLLDEAGRNAVAGEPLRNENFHAFGEPLYAVADGRVAAVRSGLSDHPAGTSPSGLAFEDMPGNHVVLQIAEGAFALYPHLQDESIAVSPGERVRRGQLIGRIGNSGNTSAPHLHFHVSDRPEPNLGDGVPFVFRAFELLVEGYAFRADQVPLPADGASQERSVPRLGWVIRFPPEHPRHPRQQGRDQEGDVLSHESHRR